MKQLLIIYLLIPVIAYARDEVEINRQPEGLTQQQRIKVENDLRRNDAALLKHWQDRRDEAIKNSDKNSPAINKGAAK